MSLLEPTLSSSSSENNHPVRGSTNPTHSLMANYWSPLIHQLKHLKRKLLENEKGRKFLQQTKEFYSFAREFSKKDLFQFLQDRLEIVLYCFIAGLLIGFFLLSRSTTHLDQDDITFSQHPKHRDTFSYPLPGGFHQDKTTQNDLNLLRHFFMVSSRSLLNYEGGPIDAFGSSATVLKSSSQHLDPTVFFKNFTLKSKPLVIESACAGWKAKREWTDIKYLQSGADASTQVVFEKSKNEHDLIYGSAVPGQTTQFETTNFQTFLSKWLNSKHRVSLIENIKHFKQLQHDIPKWPLLFSNGFYTHIATHLSIMSHELATRLNLNPYETLQCQIVGSSSFLLYDPFQLDLLYQKNHKNPMIEFDPYHPNNFKLHPLFQFARPLHAELNEGDCLFIPSFWIYSHKTRHGDSSSYNIGVQYQYSPVSTAQRVTFESIIANDE
ncbi:hypothetical protein C9374_009515 [Naegleria lovaniensis]|uniref:Cupin-like domain-containing protein n=1 Tax=Naegleria lovaniensis TaxID=51637 RepID=A0AA88H1G2_NAELO|nr:uncharacterized protein C9374_009515 [Naegleria lovaniensis]KAG2392938.1 hypothetical protein C9374_009515 [Naegleria lovaniensis]